jgi:DNA-binding MarR family transcriptional regulator
MGKLYKQAAFKSYQISMLESRAHRAVTNFMTDYTAKLGLSLPEWSVLGVLYEHDNQQPAKIAGLLGVKPPVATNLISDLERKGLVGRAPHERDSRSAIITLSAKGHHVVAISEKQLSNELRAFFGDLTWPEVLLYMRILTKLAAKV